MCINLLICFTVLLDYMEGSTGSEGDEELSLSEKLGPFPRIVRLSRFGRGTFVSKIGEQLSQLHSFDISIKECPRTTKCLPSAQACADQNISRKF